MMKRALHVLWRSVLMWPQATKRRNAGATVNRDAGEKRAAL